MKKTIKLQNLDCANCASKIENGIKKLQGVTDIHVNFMSQKMQLEASDEDFESVFHEAKKIMKKIDPDIVINS